MKAVEQFYNKYNYPKVNLYNQKKKRMHKNLMKRILSYANLKLEDTKNMHILDAGCGTGDKSVYLSYNGSTVTSIDISLGQLKEAMELAKRTKTDIRFALKDLVNDDLFNLGKFDLILSLGVLHHTEDAKKGFENLAKLLKPNGKIIIALYHRYSRLRYRILRFLIRSFISKDPEKIMDWVLNSKLAEPLRKASISTLYDRYAVPFESYHTLMEVQEWFDSAGIEMILKSNNVKGFEFLKIFERKTLFFVGGIKK
jgi:SAM-dependent methyltransferase